MLLNDAINSIDGVIFFFSCISSVCSNPNVKQTRSYQNSQEAETDTYPCVAFFVVYEPSEKCSDNTFFAALHNHDVEPTITPIRVRNHGNEEMETAARQLFQVVKDHNNQSIQDMIDVSNTYCYRNASVESSEAESEDEEEYEEFHPKHFPTVPCCFVIVKHGGFLQAFESAIKKLESDGLVVETTLDTELETVAPGTCSNDVISTIRKIERVMEMSKHALYRGIIYYKPNGAQLTYVKLMDISSYLNKLLANQAINQDLLKHFSTVERILSHPACEIVQQINFDFNLIEVSNGFCFLISLRTFVHNPIGESQIGKLSPRAYVPYDCYATPEPRYFREGVYNSFPDEEVRLNFLNKFFQCLMAFKMPQKSRKLVVAGPRDSGKTSWANIFHRIIPPEYIASITNERQFSASMINNDTQLVIIDEWCATRMNSELAKTILQGGWMVTAVKHGQPRCVNSFSPFYITTNSVPDFGAEDDNVRRRIQIFETSSLPATMFGIDKWLFDNSMHCISWIADQINRNRSLIAPEELWYEERSSHNSLVPSLISDAQWTRSNIVQITEADLEPAQNPNRQPNDETVIHPGFVAEFKSRRLARKRQRSRQLFVGDTSSDDDSLSNVELVDQDIENMVQASTPSPKDLQVSQIEPVQPSSENDNTTAALPTSEIEHQISQVQQVEASDENENNTAAIPTSPIEHQISEVQPVEASNENENTTAALPTSPTEQPSTRAPQDLPMAPVADVSTETTDPPIQPPATIVNQQPSTSHEGLQPPDDTPERWQLNNIPYMTKVANLIKYKFYKNLQKGHVHSFIERWRQAKLKRDFDEIAFWTKADPEIDAWMLATGRLREVFNLDTFVEQHPDIVPHLEQLRKTLNVRVLASRCPVVEALRKRANPDEQRTDDAPQLSSQTFWTTIKKWLR